MSVPKMRGFAPVCKRELAEYVVRPSGGPALKRLALLRRHSFHPNRLHIFRRHDLLSGQAFSVGVQERTGESQEQREKQFHKYLEKRLS